MCRILVVSAALIALSASMIAQETSIDETTMIASNTSSLNAQQRLGASSTGIEPYRIKEDVLGESLAQYQQNNSAPAASNSYGKSGAALKDCTLQESFAAANSHGVVECTSFNTNDAATYAGLTYRWRTVKFVNSSLHEVDIVLHHSGYESLKNAMIEKFGKPVRMEKQDLQTGIATHLEATNLYWNNGTSTIAVFEYQGDQETTMVQFTLDDENGQAQETEKKEAIATSSSDM